jgi:hypothetical protein
MSKPPSRFSDWRLRLGLWIGFPILILGIAGMIVAAVEGYPAYQASYRPNAGMSALGSGIGVSMMLLIGIGATIVALFGAALLSAVYWAAKRASRSQLTTRRES